MIELRNLSKKKLSKKRIDDIAQAFFKKYKIKPEVEISLALVSDTKMKEINLIYRGKNKTTDVLSFPDLNEIIISPAQIEKQARELGRSFSQEFDFILVHGLLHLLGYSDKTEKERLEMIKLGEKFLAELAESKLLNSSKTKNKKKSASLKRKKFWNELVEKTEDQIVEFLKQNLIEAELEKKSKTKLGKKTEVSKIKANKKKTQKPAKPTKKKQVKVSPAKISLDKKKQNKPNRLKKAFTLIEMILVLFIVGMLSAIIVANYNVGYNESELINSQNMIQQNLRLAQSYALNSKTYNGVVPEYWGLSFSMSDQKIYLFADLNGNYLPDVGEMDDIYGGKKITLPDEIFFENAFSVAMLSALFSSGSGEMVIYDSDSAALNYLDWQVEFRDKHFNRGRIIYLQPGYLIETSSCSCNDADILCCSFCASGSNCVQKIDRFFCGTSFLDSRDNNEYATIKMGNQCWFAENLRYNNGCLSKSGTDGEDTGWCRDAWNGGEKRGLVYQWSAAMNEESEEGDQGLCPPGWHVPSNDEFIALIDYIKSDPKNRCDSNANYLAKAFTANTGWAQSTGVCHVGNNQSINNSSGFNALSVGYSITKKSGYARGAWFWTSTTYSSDASKAHIVNTDYNSNSISCSAYNAQKKYYGYSVRCLKD